MMGRWVVREWFGKFWMNLSRTDRIKLNHILYLAIGIMWRKIWFLNYFSKKIVQSFANDLINFKKIVRERFGYSRTFEVQNSRFSGKSLGNEIDKIICHKAWSWESGTRVVESFANDSVRFEWIVRDETY